VKEVDENGVVSVCGHITTIITTYQGSRTPPCERYKNC